MRVVRPIAEIDNGHAESAWWGLMVCIMVFVISAACFGGCVAHEVQKGETDRARIHACRLIANPDAQTRCIRGDEPQGVEPR